MDNELNRSTSRSRAGDSRDQTKRPPSALRLKTPSSREAVANFLSQLTPSPKREPERRGSIFRPTGRLKKAAHLVVNARNFTTALQENAEQAKVSEVHAPPACLKAILGKIRAEDKRLKSEIVESHLELNKKMMNSLLISNIDTEEVEAAITNIDYDMYELGTVNGKNYVPREKYETVTKSRYDTKKHQFVFQTSIIITTGDEEKIKQPPHIVRKDRTYLSIEPRVMTPGDVKKTVDDLMTRSLYSIQYRDRLVAQGQPLVKMRDQSLTPLSKELTDRYFGDEACVAFFQHYRKMQNNLDQLAVHGINPSFLNNHNSNGGSIILTHRTIDTALSGDDAPGSTVNSAIGSPVGSASSAYRGQKGGMLTQPSVTGTNSIHTLTSIISHDLFSDLQSISSNDNAKIKIDSDLLQPHKLDYTEAKQRAQALSAMTPSSKVVAKRLLLGPAQGIKGSSKKKTVANTTAAYRSNGEKVANNNNDNDKQKRNSKLSTAAPNTSSASYHQLQRPQVALTPLDLHLKRLNEQQSKLRSMSNDSGGHSDDVSSLGNDESVGGTPLARRRAPRLAVVNPKEVSANKEEVKGWETLSAITPSSPRTKYIAGCIREGLHPLPHIIIRREMNSVLNLSHFALGDKMGKVLAECLADLPCVEAIDLSDNHLTDISLHPLILAIINIPKLKELNLSRNKIDGESSDALAAFFSRADCPIEKLILQDADVDDGECDRFVQCLLSNECLLELDMSSNLLGTAEGSSTAVDSPVDSSTAGRPSTASTVGAIRTGGAAIAEYLQSTSCRLKTLKLGWNTIRARSAVTLSTSLAYNSTLLYLDLNNNGMGALAGESLGEALLDNQTLQTLLVNNNGFTASAAICICVGITQNQALKRVDMNENPIGSIGAAMIMQSSMAWGSRVKVDARNCNTFVNDERCWFDPVLPCRFYDLHLNKPFDRAVAFHLLQLVAAHSTFVISFSQYRPDSTTSNRVHKLELTQAIATDREKYLDTEQLKVLHGLRLMHSAANNTELATQLFHQADADHSGKLDKDELREVLREIGFQIDADRLHDIFAFFDIDGAGCIDESEFTQLLRSQAREAHLRIKEMTDYPITISKQSKERYIPPRKGILSLAVKDGFIQKNAFLTVNAVDQKFTYTMAKGIGDVSLMSEAVRYAKLRYSEGLHLYRTIYKETQDKAAVLLKVIPQMMLASEARQLLLKASDNNRIELARVKLAFGVSLRPMLGAYNGHYCLDLSKEIHRICLGRLLEQSQTWNSKRMLRLAQSNLMPGNKVGDLSQHGNWSCFRNEVMSSTQKIAITPQLFTPMPRSGILEFDFFCGGRPFEEGKQQLMQLSDKRVCKVLNNLCLLPTETWSDSMKKLTQWQRRSNERSKDGLLAMPIYAFSVNKAREVSTHMDTFYDQLFSRREKLKEGEKKEEVRIYIHHTNALRAANRGHNTTDGNNDEAVEEDLLLLEEEQLAAANTNNSNASSSVHQPLEENQQRRHIAEQKQRLTNLLAARGIPLHAKAARFVEAIDETFTQLWISARHLALILHLFQQLFGANLGRTEAFGSYCVEIFVFLYAKVVDLYNIELVWEVLEASEIAAIFCRVGVLNLFNPFKPEVTLEMAMDRREERLLTKIIVYLSVVEPGINLTYKEFKWKVSMEPIPGWDVTEAWMTEAGLPVHGRFLFTYYSGEGRHLLGCIPNLPLRRAMSALTLVDETDVAVDNKGEGGDDENQPPAPHSAGKHYAKNQDVWISYLAATSSE